MYLHYKQTEVQTSRAGGSIVEIGNTVMHRLVKWQPQPESVAPSMSPHQSLCVKNIAPYLIMIHLYYDSLQTLTTSARGFWAAREEATFLCKLRFISSFNSDKSLLVLLLIFFVTCDIHYVKLAFICLRIFDSLFSDYFQLFQHYSWALMGFKVHLRIFFVASILFFAYYTYKSIENNTKWRLYTWIVKTILLKNVTCSILTK